VAVYDTPLRGALTEVGGFNPFGLIGTGLRDLLVGLNTASRGSNKLDLRCAGAALELFYSETVEIYIKEK